MFRCIQQILFALFLSCFTLPLFAKNSILILGDSLSAGYGIEVNTGWVELLRARLKEHGFNYTVENISISGNTTSNGLTQLPSALTRFQPSITIIELGGNDGLRGISLTTIRKNLQTLISLAKANNSKVLLVGLRLPPNYGPVYTEEFQKIYLTLAKENNIAVVPLFLKGIDEDVSLMSADHIHPTMKAQIILLNNVWASLQPML